MLLLVLSLLLSKQRFMGQSASNMVFVATNRYSYFSGDVVQGTVNVNCSTPLRCQALHLLVRITRCTWLSDNQITGEESTHWMQRRTRQHTVGTGEHRRVVTETYHVPQNGCNVFLRVRSRMPHAHIQDSIAIV